MKQTVKPPNPYQKQNFQDNFIDSEALDDPDAIEQYQAKAAPEPPKILFKKFHEIAPSYRVAILLYLCQNKLDTESPEYMAELQRITKPQPLPAKKKKQKKESDAESSEAEKIQAEAEHVEKIVFQEL